MKLVVVGGVAAGASIAARARRLDEFAEIIVLERGHHVSFANCGLPYHIGGVITDRSRLLVQTPQSIREALDLDVRIGHEVVSIDPTAKTVTVRRVDDGTEYTESYDALALTPGAEALRPPIAGIDLPGVHVLRTLSEADGLSAALKSAGRIVIIGAGYIGLEVAASVRKRGHDVVVLEAADRPMARTASPLIGGWFGALHRGYGVDLRVSEPVAAIIEREGKAAGVRLGDGEEIEADLVLVAAGLVLNTGLAEAAGLSCEDGILTDTSTRTSDPSILAAGDVARFHSGLYGRSIRLESVQNAIEQGKAAAATICGDTVHYDPVPWFWSDQFEIKLQIAGLIEGADEIVRRGDPEMGRFAVFHLKEGRIIACEAVNAAPEYMAAQKLIAARRQVDAQAFRNLDVAMRDLLS